MLLTPSSSTCEINLIALSSTNCFVISCRFVNSDFLLLNKEIVGFFWIYYHFIQFKLVDDILHAISSLEACSIVCFNNKKMYLLARYKYTPKACTWSYFFEGVTVITYLYTLLWISKVSKEQTEVFILFSIGCHFTYM